MEGLTEGRIVHFIMEDGEHLPAIVVHVYRYINNFDEPPHALNDGLCNLQVFRNEKSIPMWKTSVLYDEAGTPGTWHWIEKA